MEVRVGITSDEEDIVVRGFLSGFKLVSLSQEVAESAVKIRQGHNVKLPDAIIWASAQTENALLVTRNTKDFGFDDVGIRIPYRL